MKPYCEENGIVIYHGECLETMRQMPSDSIDACVTDPPYGLSFMSRSWDYNVPSVEIFAEIYRLLKDGSRLLCFAGTRTMHRMWVSIEDAGFTIEDSIAWMYGSGFPKHKSKLKPAYEPICVARKGRVSALNIDECRIGEGGQSKWERPRGSGFNDSFVDNGKSKLTESTQGRWPANVILDEVAAEMLDEQSGTLTSNGGKGAHQIQATENRNARRSTYGHYSASSDFVYGDTGGASRFFYCAKASKAERDAGLDDLPEKASREWRTGNVHSGHGRRVPDKIARNTHPTVKPISLMSYLCKLITPKGGLVLDPFCGSGSTGVGAILKGFSFIGIDSEAEYCELSTARILRKKDFPLFEVKQ